MLSKLLQHQEQREGATAHSHPPRSLESLLYYGDIPFRDLTAGAQWAGKAHMSRVPASRGVKFWCPSTPPINLNLPVCLHTHSEMLPKGGKHLDISVRKRDSLSGFRGPGAGQAHMGFEGWPHSITHCPLRVSLPQSLKMPCTFLEGPKGHCLHTLAPRKDQGLGTDLPQLEVCA